MGDVRREIYYRASGQLVAVTFDAAGASPSLGTPTPLFPLRSAVASQLRARTDGQRFLVATSTDDTATIAPLTVIMNWAGAGRYLQPALR
jgi:hypothetical protein